MNWKKLGLSLLTGLLCSPVMAVEFGAPTDAELASLPAFCKARLKAGMGSPEYITWGQTLGNDFMHTHHYCVGINYINRYYHSRSLKDKGFYLNNAEDNLSYMVTHASPEYSLMPDVYLNRGLVYSLMKQHGKSIGDMNKSIELNPKQVRAYNALADYYASTKQQHKALETVVEGLRHNPDARSLQRRYTEFGGKLPFPEPIPGSPDVALQPVAVTPSNKMEEPTVSEKSTSDAPVSAPIMVPEESARQIKIGTPGNPYCRFCPD